MRRNNEITLDEIAALAPTQIVISPGPGRPEQAGITLDVIKRFGPTIPLLGVCLGHQAIGMAFGGLVVRANAPMHGKTSTIKHDGRGVFAGIASPFTVARYHSLIVQKDGLPKELEVTAQTEDDGTVMALRHRTYPIHGVQFHPESIMTREGAAPAAKLSQPWNWEMSGPNISALLEKVMRRENLTMDESADAMGAIMSGEATPAEIAALLMGLSMKGERPMELVGLATTMRANAVKLSKNFTDVFDTCGTGGDRSGTFNISSAAALVVAAAGLRVAKHGNRSVSSKCGSADVYEALGVDVAAAPSVVEQSLATVGIAFFFAPTFHPSMKHAAPVRRELGVRTAFNLLGPMTNPAGARRQLVGVPQSELTELMARALLLLGTERAWVVHGADGIDEMSTTGHTKVSECRNGSVSTFYVHPSDFGLPKAATRDLQGGDAATNADIMRAVLAAERGPRRDVVLLNAGAGLFIGGKAASVREGIQRAADAIDSGAATRTLAAMVRPRDNHDVESP